MTTSYNDFVGEVQHRIEVGDQAEAVYRAKAVVALLGETVPGGEFADLVDQLPAAYDDLFAFVDVVTEPWAEQARAS